MFGGRSSWIRHSTRFFNVLHKTPRFCNSTTQNNNNSQHTRRFSSNDNMNGRATNLRDMEGYRDLDNLNFMKAAKILFSAPAKKKTFGLDFHLVQLLFALMPSLAVYLVAQYARYDIKKMEAELELKKKADEKQKAKEMEAAAVLEKEAESANPELLMVKERLEALEETLKDIVVETKKRPIEEKRKNADQHQHQHQERADPNRKSGDNHIHIPVKNQPTQEATSG
ncbi:uncharacterized protein [Spinacia oleracea]|uniref:Uncharacterized protein n=1 Tax=Spinacia oleracea TaxID=3562 RepID=A0A9R0K5V2_SPIOL|nr:uncharacterized protein LOC110798735 [Spinacia oleracea]